MWKNAASLKQSRARFNAAFIIGHWGKPYHNNPFRCQ